MITTQTNKQTQKQTNKQAKQQTAETDYATIKLVYVWF